MSRCRACGVGMGRRGERVPNMHRMIVYVPTMNTARPARNDGTDTMARSDPRVLWIHTCGQAECHRIAEEMVAEAQTLHDGYNYLQSELIHGVDQNPWHYHVRYDHWHPDLKPGDRRPYGSVTG